MNVLSLGEGSLIIMIIDGQDGGKGCTILPINFLSMSGNFDEKKTLSYKFP